MVTHPVEVVDVGVDWITLTASHPDLCFKQLTRAGALLQRVQKQGFMKHPFSMQGYTGFRAGSVELGARPGGTLVRLGSNVARDYWKDIFYVSENCSRIDLQVTLRYHRTPSQEIARHYRNMLRAHSREAGGPTVSMFRSSDGGATLYVGKRSSRLFGRIYDKGVESGLEEFQNTMRAEVEYKGDVARFVSREVANSGVPLIECRERVAQFFKERHCDLRILTTSELRQCRTAQPADVWRTLEWIRTSVRLSARKLVAGGLQQQLLDALGLSIGPQDQLVLSKKPESNSQAN